MTRHAHTAQAKRSATLRGSGIAPVDAIADAPESLDFDQYFIEAQNLNKLHD